LTEINENESGIDTEAVEDVNTDVNTEIVDDVNDVINTDVNTDVNAEPVDGVSDGIDTDVNTDVNTEIVDDVNDVIDTDNNADVNAEVVDNVNDVIDTDVNADVNTETVGDVNDGINTDINTDNTDTAAADAPTASAQDDEGSVDATRILEALLFASDELLTPSKLKAILPGSPDARHIRKMAGEINERLLTEGHPFEIIEAGGGYQFRTLSAFHPYVRKLYKERAAKKLSIQALECLAIIAYRQPISKAEVEAIRGVLSDGAMKTLLERKLIDLCGRSDKPGRPWLYGTTADFLRYFGINKIGDLPRMEEFEQMARAKMEEMSAEELSGEKEVAAEESAAGEAVQTEAAPAETAPTEP